MRQEYGRSLIEMLGVFAIAGAMTVSAISIYNVIRNNQARKIASSEIEQIASNTKLLLQLRGDYTGVSVDYLVKAGALKNNSAPIGGANWSVTAENGGAEFAINLTELSEGECEYFTIAVPDWAKAIKVNGFETDITSQCFSSRTNQVSFIVE